MLKCFLCETPLDFYDEWEMKTVNYCGVYELFFHWYCLPTHTKDWEMGAPRNAESCCGLHRWCTKRECLRCGKVITYFYERRNTFRAITNTTEDSCKHYVLL